jgi:hypothetical protein
MKHPLLVIAAFLLSLIVETSARAETPGQWIEIGPRIHGAFGAFIPIGIRVGLDAKEKLNAGARGLGVTFYNGEKAVPLHRRWRDDCNAGKSRTGHIADCF